MMALLLSTSPPRKTRVVGVPPHMPNFALSTRRKYIPIAISQICQVQKCQQQQTIIALEMHITLSDVLYVHTLCQNGPQKYSSWILFF